MFVILKKDYFGQKAGTTLDIEVQRREDALVQSRIACPDFF